MLLRPRNTSDLLVVYLFAREVGLITPSGDGENCDLLMMPFTACASCETFTCRSCKAISGLDTRNVLPFCELCNFGDNCAICERIKKYLENYPEEKGMIAHIE